jgi:hypothetical protein
MRKKLLILSFALGLFTLQACKKHEAFQQDNYIQNAQFFSRYGTDAASAATPDFIDTIINLMKAQDLKMRFANQVLTHYGSPKWNQSVALSNANGLKTLVIPVVNSETKVPLLIFAYQTETTIWC